ncbi:kinase-like domain-containing protein, partial [Mycena pura]
VKLSNLLVGNSLYYEERDLEDYLESHPVETVADVGELQSRHYPIFKEQPIPHPYTWDTSAFEAEKMFIYLIDFGHAQRAGEQPTEDCFGALALRAPEVILWSDFGPGVDIWAVGCITFELLVGRWLFDPEEGEDWSVEDDHLAKIMELTGQRFPQSMLDRAKRRKQYFSDDGNLLKINKLIPTSLETAMANYSIPGLSEDEIGNAADFIRACLRLDYKERATAKELLNHPFLSNAFKC